jgi:hypothetical protein
MTDEEKVAKLNSLVSSNGTGDYHLYNTPVASAYLTDGIKHMAEIYGAYWLIDLILSYQTKDWKKDHPPRDYPFQYWTLRKNPDESCSVSMDYMEGIPEIIQKIEYTDFPEDSFTIKYSAFDSVLTTLKED